MSSTTSGLSRARTLRKPTGGLDNNTTNNNKDAAPVRASRIASPTRLKTPSTTTTANSPRSVSSVTKSLRPLSGFASGLGRTFSTRDKRAGPAPEPAKSATAPPLRKNSTASSFSTRPTSLVRPRTAAGPGSTGNPPVSTRSRAQTHTRTKSQGVSLTAATTIQPPSSASSGSYYSRPVSVQSSASSGSGPAKTVQTHRRQPSNSRPSTATTAPAHHLLSKPAFNTLQQHYSPAKSHAPKPTTASFLAPPSPSKLPANVQATAETNKLQSELLQLHLIHRDAEEVDVQWRASAKKKLGERFSSIVKANADIEGLEREAVEEKNASVLKAWLTYNGDVPSTNFQGRPRAGSRAAHYGMEEKIQALDSVVTGLWSMGEVGGKYSRVIRKFERWVSRAGDAMGMRCRGRGGGAGDGGGMLALLQANPDPSLDGSGNEGGLFVGGLDEGWKEECAILYRKLDGWRRTLKDIGEVQPDNDERGGVPMMAMDHNDGALARTLTGCRDMVHDMLAELDAMERVERDAVAAENEWVRRVNREEDVVEEGTRRAGAIWRSI